MAECQRAVFAAFLWHEGLVHDAMACATYLKFHPAGGGCGGARPVSPGRASCRPQRHSLEVSGGRYLQKGEEHAEPG